MKQPKFKKGEWCFCEFTLQQVSKTEGDRITSVTDGFFSLGSNDLTDRCYPLDITIKVISDNVQYWSKEFHKLNNNALNYPDLNRALISKWVDMCEAKDNQKKLKELYEDLSEFGNSVCRRVRDLSFEEVNGVNLFRR